MTNVLGIMAAFIVVVLVVGVGGFCLFTALAGGADKPNGGQQTTNVHVNVNVAAPPAAPAVMPAADYHATLAAHAALAARAQAELYGPPAMYGRPELRSATIYGQLPNVHQAPGIDYVDQAVEAALARRLDRPELER